MSIQIESRWRSTVITWKTIQPFLELGKSTQDKLIKRAATLLEERSTDLEIKVSLNSAYGLGYEIGCEEGLIGGQLPS